MTTPKTRHVLGEGFYTAADSGARPRILGVTVHDCAAPGEADEIRRYGPGLVDQLHHTPGFLSGLGVGFGQHFITISAWSDPASPHRFATAGLHAGAVGHVTNDRFTAGGMHSLWLPHRLRRLLRCPYCHNVADTEKTGARCPRCHNPMPINSSYL